MRCLGVISCFFLWFFLMLLIMQFTKLASLKINIWKLLQLWHHKEDVYLIKKQSNINYTSIKYYFHLFKKKKLFYVPLHAKKKALFFEKNYYTLQHIVYSQDIALYFS